MTRSTSPPAEGRRVQIRGVCFQAGNTDFRDARNRCSHSVRQFNDIPIDAPALVRVVAWKRIINPETTYDNGREEDTFTADIAFQNPFAVPSAPLIKAPIYLDYGLRVHIAPTAFINRNCVILDTPVADVRIGDHANIGPNVTIISVGHSQGVDEHGKRLSNGSDVIIGDYTWIGARVTILPGVEIGCHSIIGAGSVVTKDVPAFSVAHGNPARVMRKIGDEVANEPEDIITGLKEALEYQGRGDGMSHG
ncbi:hypothetical protein CEP52_010072 [Fusarium oligoseptatum]|uniref:Uncharacterized protein n=1 Tax=Fusarium oligoseptatum TaxID=2604345 RepID=A0A428T9Z8_9HYPO|nr:hypothetical protein CEP52_010072 [Fusarium oligoseptatum]